jgi:hypothetical protein
MLAKESRWSYHDGISIGIMTGVFRGLPRPRFGASPPAVWSALGSKPTPEVGSTSVCEIGEGIFMIASNGFFEPLEPDDFFDC